MVDQRRFRHPLIQIPPPLVPKQPLFSFWTLLVSVWMFFPELDKPARPTAARPARRGPARVAYHERAGAGRARCGQRRDEAAGSRPVRQRGAGLFHGGP